MGFEFKRALVTGGAGFIGSHIIEELLKRDVEVISIDDFSAGKEENISKFMGKKNFTSINCDVTDYNRLERYFNGVHVVFHQAASKKTVCLKDPRRDLEVNALGTFNVLEACREHHVKKFVYASTGSVYGEARYFPQDEEHPLNPTSFYGTSKMGAEKYVNIFARLYGLNTTILRYFHVYGPRQEYSDFGGVIPIFIRRLLNGQPPIIFGDGTQQRSFTYVKDVVFANLLVASRDDASGECYNCASGIKVTINELAHKLADMMGMSHLSPIYEDWAPGDIKVFDIDNSKLKGLGFEFQTSFDEGLRKTVEWYKKRLGRNE